MSLPKNIKINTSTIYRVATMTMPNGKVIKKRFSIMDEDKVIVDTMSTMSTSPAAGRSTKSTPTNS